MSDDTPKLTHLDDSGAARMVDVGAKPETARLAIATGAVLMAPETLTLIRTGDVAKGDVLGAARIAGIMAAKRTSDLIPLCHPLPLSAVEVELEPVGNVVQDDRIPHAVGQPVAGVLIRATARVTARTGVEMEALTAVTGAALTIYDMAKAVDRGMILTGIRLLKKTGGKVDWNAEEIDDDGS